MAYVAAYARSLLSSGEMRLFVRAWALGFLIMTLLLG
jgi:hypothetical protein